MESAGMCIFMRFLLLSAVLVYVATLLRGDKERNGTEKGLPHKMTKCILIY